MKLAVIAFCTVFAFASEAPAYAATTAFRTPDDAVNALYKLPSIPIKPATMRRFFTRDLAAALIKDAAPPGGGVGVANDADYRYDAQDTQITNFSIEDYAGGPGAEVLRAHFNNFGQPFVVSYDLCLHGPNDWRISNVTMTTDNLRKMLGLGSVDKMKRC